MHDQQKKIKMAIIEQTDRKRGTRKKEKTKLINEWKKE